MFAVELFDLKKEYKMGEISIHALAGISFSVQQGEILAVVGESGSGKSTLLHILGTLDSPSSGNLYIGGQNPFVGSDKQISAFRNCHLGFVFQHGNLLPEFNALENIMMPALIAGKSQREIRAKAMDLLKQVDLEKRYSHFPSQMSGGEQQRVAIARSLINDPVLVLADEPSGNLDSKNAIQVHDIFFNVNKNLGATVLIVTHNKEFAAALPRRIRLRDGSIVADEKT